MHRHGYKGRKLGRERDQRIALIRSLSVALIEHGSIETTLPKAKELRPGFEKLVSKAKKGDLHNRRQVVQALASVPSAHKLVDEIAPAITRTSGYLRIERTRLRRGDNAQMARISFVDKVHSSTDNDNQKTAATTEKAAKTTTAKETASKPKPAATTASAKNTTVAATPKRTGRRGNK